MKFLINVRKGKDKPKYYEAFTEIDETLLTTVLNLGRRAQTAWFVDIYYRQQFNQAIMNLMLERGVPAALYVCSDLALACYSELAGRLNIPIEKRPTPPELWKFRDDVYPAQPVTPDEMQFSPGEDPFHENLLDMDEGMSARDFDRMLREMTKHWFI